MASGLGSLPHVGVGWAVVEAVGGDRGALLQCTQAPNTPDAARDAVRGDLRS